MVCTIFYASLALALLNVGNLTHLKVFQSKIYLAGSTGVACLTKPGEVLCQFTLAAADTRLIEVDENGVVFTTYDYDGLEKKVAFGLTGWVM